MIKDVLMDESGELRMSGRDVAVRDAGEQVCGLLAETHTGEWKNAPLAGWNIRSYVAAPRSEAATLKPQIMEDLRRNNLAGRVKIERGEIVIELEK